MLRQITVDTADHSQHLVVSAVICQQLQYMTTFQNANKRFEQCKVSSVLDISNLQIHQIQTVRRKHSLTSKQSWNQLT
jgi:hypothetical protein